MRDSESRLVPFTDLDEATSLLDTGSARELERSLNAVLEGRTVIEITELGPHQDLIAAGGS
ncbi:hypothetical protein [Amycolatopsis dendrobii]|uniref:Uncharacterized protein n=1 Tax=Amycolatopsis dendrobii TaxID=2760662 RepID=A0A7W3VZX1_9PSEU|nr:hypothetical protein [Amycolatopsis dendrobii]MBB1155747.1 hypothetical protein [Amycolatopsis dendrobii]